jgi:hypothetical protein
MRDIARVQVRRTSCYDEDGGAMSEDSFRVRRDKGLTPQRIAARVTASTGYRQFGQVDCFRVRSPNGSGSHSDKGCKSIESP